MTGRGCGKLQLCIDTHVVRSCGKLQQSGGSDVEKTMLKGKRDGEFGSVLSQEQERFLSERQHLHDNLERKTRRALQGECMAQRKISEAEMETDWVIWDKRNSDWPAMYDTNSQPESQKTELHHANQWACQAQMESRSKFEELTMKRRLYQENHASDCM